MQNSTAFLHKIENLSVIRISGEDCLTFLQGQLTNDIEQLTDCWQFSGYCSPKGRLLTLLRLWKHDDSVYAVLGTSTLETIVKRLQMYVMRSKVVIEVLNNAQFFGLINTNQGSSNFNLLVEQNIHKLDYENNQLLVDLDAALTSPATQISNDNAAWDAENILNGIPNITQETYEMFVPQMVNLDVIGGVNFKKGCYTGQEIVARMHYLGKLKQRMFLCDLTNDQNVTTQSGDKVFLNLEKDELKSAGNLVSVNQVRQIALAVLRIEMVEAYDSFYLENGAKLTIKSDQPYDLSL